MPRSTPADGAGPVAAASTAADLRARGPGAALTAEHVLDEVLRGTARCPRRRVGLVEVKGPATGVRYEGLEELILRRARPRGAPGARESE